MDRASAANRSPVTLFLELWNEVVSLSGFQRLTAATPDPNFQNLVDTALIEENGAHVYDTLYDIIETAQRGALRNEKNGALVVTMQRIDNIFLEIHPRTQFVAAAAGGRRTLPSWLREVRGVRLVFGHYLQVDTCRIVPRGPLVRLPRAEFAANAENMVDMFSALTVVPLSLIRGKRQIKVEHLVVSSASFGGVGLGAHPGGETVLFVPVAEQSSDLTISSRKLSTQDFADFRLSPRLNASDILVAAIRNAGVIDIAIAPELVVSEVDSDAFMNELARSPMSDVRMIVAGTGHTTLLSADGNAWNEARIVNGRGHEIWRQRKIWPAGLNSDRAKLYGITHTGNNVIEDNAEGDTVVVADVEGLGRCVVLICQDIEARPLTDDLIREFQPDWVFVPILDPGIHPGRWAHQRAFELSGNSNARYLVASSTALARPSASSAPAVCGIAVGPKSASSSGSDEGRLFAEATVQLGAKLRYAKIIWRSGVWHQTQLSVKVVCPVPGRPRKKKLKSYMRCSKKRR